MGNLKNLVTLTLSQIIAIVDAAFKGDPAGTIANKAYFNAHVHNYIKDLGIASQPTKHYMVSPGYSSLGSPFFASLAAAYTQIVADTSSSSDIAAVEMNQGVYGDGLTLDSALAAFNIYWGKALRSSVVSGTVAITAGTHIFINQKFTNTISVNGATAILLNCTQTTGDINLTGGASVRLSDCPNLGEINVTGDNNTLNIDNCMDIGLDGDSKSIELASGMVGGVYVGWNLRCRGTIEQGTPFTELNNYLENAQALISF